MDKGAWRATGHRVGSQRVRHNLATTQQKQQHSQTCTKEIFQPSLSFQQGIRDVIKESKL